MCLLACFSLVFSKLSFVDSRGVKNDRLYYETFRRHELRQEEPHNLVSVPNVVRVVNWKGM
jgi:hypothetical protein